MLYRCCFLDHNDNIEALEEIDADTLVVAIEQTRAMLKEEDRTTTPQSYGLTGDASFARSGTVVSATPGAPNPSQC